jgi:hypothetical protein
MGRLRLGNTTALKPYVESSGHGVYPFSLRCDRHLDQNVTEFHRKFPRQRFNFAKLSQHLAQMFRQFCHRKRREIANFVESACVFWNVDISDPPEWAQKKFT